MIKNKKSIYLGNFAVQSQGAWRDTERPVAYGDGLHLLTVGPTGCGKGAGLIMPNLSYLERSMIVIDPKGEAATITARKRATIGDVVVIDPFKFLAEAAKVKPVLRSQGYNPLVGFPLQNTARFNVQATKLAEAFVPVRSTTKDPFWEQSAQAILTAFIMAEVVVARRERRTPSLAKVRNALCEPPHDNFKQMANLGVQAITNKIGDFDVGTGGDEKTLQSVMMTLRAETASLDDDELVADLSVESKFDFKVMRERIVTVYLVIPLTDVRRNAKWLRLMILSALRAFIEARGAGPLGPVLFLLDEFANLGRLEDIEEAMNWARGHGIQLWPIVQHLGQLKRHYEDGWEDFISGAAVVNAFGCQDNFTAKYLSEAMGYRTEIVQSQNMGEGPGGERSGMALSQVGVPLFRPEDIRRLPKWHILQSLRGQMPFITHAPLYRDTPFKAGLDPSLYH